MKRYSVTAKRWGHGWELHIGDVGVTQCRVLDDAVEMVNDYLDTLGFDAGEVDVVVDLGSLSSQVQRSRSKTVEAQRASEEAAALSRATADALRGAGLSVSDGAYVMGVSRGRFSQLTSRESAACN